MTELSILNMKQVCGVHPSSDGITAGLESGQWSIVGGTGQFIMAQGIISFTNHPASTFEDGIKELNIRVRFTRDITQAVSIIL